MGCNCKQQNDWRKLLETYGDDANGNDSSSNFFIRCIQNMANIIVTVFMVILTLVLFCILFPPLVIYFIYCIITHKEPVVHLDKFFSFLDKAKGKLKK